MARRTSTAISKTDRLARQVAAAMAKGRSPRSSNELEDYFSRSPREVFTALAGFVSSMPPVGNGKDLGYGYLFLHQGLLLHLRYRIDRGYPDARGLVEEFQTAVAAGVREGSIAGSLLGLLAGVLQQAGVAASPVLIDASTALADRSTGRVSESDLDEVLAELIEACGGAPFVLVASGEEASHAMPQEARVALVTSLALAREPAVVDSGQEWRRGCLCRRGIFPSSNRLDAGEGGP
jgi:hypothetical protein